MSLLLVIYAGIISVDRFAAFHMLFSRPLVISTIVGLLTSNPVHLFYIGIMLEIFGLIDVQVGTRITREDSFLAYVLSVIAGMGYFTSVSKMLLLLLIMIILMYLAGHTERWVRNFNKYLFLKGTIPTGKLIFLGACMAFLRGIIVYPAAVFLGIGILDYFNGIFDYGLSFKIYTVFLSIFLSGYLLRFLSFRSIYKYITFISGLGLGWLLI